MIFLTWLTVITPWSSYICLAVTLTSNSFCFFISSLITYSIINCPSRLAITWGTDIRVCDLSERVLIEPNITHLTILALCIMLALQTDSTRSFCTCLKNKIYLKQAEDCKRDYRKYSRVKIAFVRMFIAVAFLAFILLLTSGRSPGQVLVEVHAVLTVVPSANKMCENCELNDCQYLVLWSHSQVPWTIPGMSLCSSFSGTHLQHKGIIRKN